MNLIYTPRHWLPRLVDIIFTLIAWAVFIWLLYSGIAEVMADQRQGPRIDMGSNLLTGLDSLLLYLVLSLLVAGILSIWAVYQKRQAAGFQRRKRVPIISDETLSNSFGVDYRLLRLLQKQQVSTLHNDEHGQLLSVEMRDLKKHYASRRQPVKAQLIDERAL